LVWVFIINSREKLPHFSSRGKGRPIILKYTKECCFVFVLQGWGLNSDFMVAKQVLYHLSHTFSSFCSDYFGDGGLMNYLLQLALKCEPPDPSLPSR
jgi:hypothetical protein